MPDDSTQPEAPASPVGSVDKALILLEILAGAGPEGMMLRDISEAGGMNKASVHRLLRALMHRGFAEQSPDDQRYRLGTAALELTHAFGAGENLSILFAPALASISQRTQELVHLGRMDGARVLYLDKVEPERIVRVWSRVGSRAPAARTAMGRAMLAADGIRGDALTAYAQATEGTAAGPVISAEAPGRGRGPDRRPWLVRRDRGERAGDRLRGRGADPCRWSVGVGERHRSDRADGRGASGGGRRAAARGALAPRPGRVRARAVMAIRAHRIA